MRQMRRGMAGYVLALRLSAAAALPTFEHDSLSTPAPIVRQLPGLMLGEWDEREIVRERGAEWIVTRTSTSAALETSISLN
jgi:hypothetical protein